MEKVIGLKEEMLRILKKNGVDYNIEGNYLYFNIQFYHYQQLNNLWEIINTYDLPISEDHNGYGYDIQVIINH
jgi:calcineurin-like phosphoesterase